MSGLSSGLRLTAGGRYALSAMSELAGGAHLAVNELADRAKLPPAFLAKVARRLARAGLLEGQSGPGGGFKLARPAADISLLAVIEAWEGSFARSACAFEPGWVCEGAACPVYCPLRRAEDASREALGAATLADLAGSLRRHPKRIAPGRDAGA